MRLGGNANAQAYFRKAGMNDLHTKIEKKYTSKAAQSYRAALSKLIEAEAAKRGEAVDGVVEDTGKSLLETLSLADAKEQEDLMKGKIQGVLVPEAKATLASQNPNAKGTLRTPPTSGNAPKLVIRKPASGTAINMLKKKPSNVGSKLRVNKLSTTTNSKNDEGFEDVESTQQAVVENERLEKKIADDAEIAKMQEVPVSSNGGTSLGTNGMSTIPIQTAPSVPQTPLSATKSPSTGPQKTTMAEGMAKLKAMNSDFFSNA